MTKKEAVSLAVIDSKVDSIIKVMDDHIKSSDDYRKITTENCDELRWHSKWLYAVSAIALLALGLITGINFFGN